VLIIRSDSQNLYHFRLVHAVIDALGLTHKKDIVVGDLGGQSSLSGDK
jgi:hypothetical protein